LAYGTKRGARKGEVTILGKKQEKNQLLTAGIAFLIVTSCIGLALVPVLIKEAPWSHSPSTVGHVLIGALYAAVCFLGILAVFFPTRCRGTFQRTQGPQSQVSADSHAIGIEGHHPNCQSFSGNRIKIGSWAFCAACSGLLVGAIIALAGSELYFFGGLSAGLGSVWLVVLGESLMLLGLAQIRFVGYGKVVLNAVFVVGSAITLVETDMLSASSLLDLYVLGLIVLLLWLRILLSEWNNRRVCQTCGSCF